MENGTALIAPVAELSQLWRCCGYDSSKLPGWAASVWRVVHITFRYVISTLGEVFMGSTQHKWLDQVGSVLETLNQGVIINDDRNRIVFANSMFLEMIKMGAEDLLGRPAAIVSARRRPSITRIYWTQGEARSRALRILRPTGRRWAFAGGCYRSSASRPRRQGIRSGYRNGHK